MEVLTSVTRKFPKRIRRLTWRSFLIIFSYFTFHQIFFSHHNQIPLDSLSPLSPSPLNVLSTSNETLITSETPLGIVMPFIVEQIPRIEANLKKWSKDLPCSDSLLSEQSRYQRPQFYFYSNRKLLSDERNRLEVIVNNLSDDIQSCFSDFRFIHASIPPELDIYDNSRPKNASWAAGPNFQFYELFNLLPSHLTHIFQMEPDTKPIKPYWLDHLLNIITNSEPFWIKGSTFRGECLISKTKVENVRPDCHQLGSTISGHINGNALYAIGNQEFKNFLNKVQNSEVGIWPYDIAWLIYLRSPHREALMRGLLKNFVYSDFIQNFASANLDFSKVKENVWTYFVHSSMEEEDVIPQIEVEESNELIESRFEARYATPKDPILLNLLKLTANHDKNIMIAFGTKNYLKVLENFLFFVKKSGIKNFMLIAMDEITVEFAKSRGVTYYTFIDETISSEEGSDSYTSSGFRHIVNQRSRIIVQILNLGYHILQSDLDVIWIKNPWPFFFKGDYDYEIQSDARVGFSETDPGAPFKEFVNSGIFYARGIPRMASFYQILISTIHDKPQIREQHLLNEILRDNVLKIRYRVLDPILFPNGFQYFSRSISQRTGVEPFCIHNNWADGFKTKRYRFRELGAWQMEDEDYFDVEKRKYLTWTEPLVTNNGWNNIRNSLRSGIALAQILNRTLILPNFYSHHKASPTVTLDYYLNYEKFSETVPDFREHSFLKRVFPTPPETIFHIDIGQGSLRELPPESQIQTFTAKGYFRGATDLEIKEWFAPYQDLPLIHLTSAFRRFHTFVDPQVQSEFDDKLTQALAPSTFIQSTASKILKALTEAAPNKKYNCVHIRRGDFPAVHKEEKSLKEVIKSIQSKLDPSEILYVASDESHLPQFRKQMKQAFPRARFWSDFEKPWYHHIYDNELGIAMRLGDVEQTVCAHANKFVGNIYSTFTTHICYFRERLGKPKDLVCQDVYDRKYPSDWAYF